MLDRRRKCNQIDADEEQSMDTFSDRLYAMRGSRKGNLKVRKGEPNSICDTIFSNAVHKMKKDICKKIRCN